MDLSIGILTGQLIGLVLFVLVVTGLVLIPVRLGRISRQLEAIRHELQRQRAPSRERE